MQLAGLQPGQQGKGHWKGHPLLIHGLRGLRQG